MRNGESGQLRGQRVREVVGELQFVRKLHFPLSSSFPPGCTLYLTNPPIHPFQLVSLLVSWPDWHLPDCYVMFYICLLVGLDWSTTWTTLVFLPAAETRPHLHDWYDTRLMLWCHLTWPDTWGSSLLSPTHGVHGSLLHLPPVPHRQSLDPNSSRYPSPGWIAAIYPHVTSPQNMGIQVSSSQLDRSSVWPSLAVGEITSVISSAMIQHCLSNLPPAPDRQSPNPIYLPASTDMLFYLQVPVKWLHVVPRTHHIWGSLAVAPSKTQTPGQPSHKNLQVPAE